MKLPAISKRDRKTLLFLFAFIAVAGLWQFLLGPLHARWGMLGKEIAGKEKELKSMNRKLRELRGNERDNEELLTRLAVIDARRQLPAAGEPVPVTLKAIMAQAAKASVAIASLRPLVVEEEEGAGKTVYFTVEGSGTNGQFHSFLERCWGMYVEELSLSHGEQRERPLRFYLKLKQLPPLPVNLPAAQVPRLGFGAGGDPFLPGARASASLKKGSPVLHLLYPPPAVPVPGSDAGVAAPAGISGLRLVGVSTIKGKRTAIVVDDAMAGRDFFLATGDTFRDGWQVKLVERKGVTFARSDGTTERVEFPAQSDMVAEVADAGRAQLKGADEKRSPKPGRLGFQVRNLSPENAAALKLGLFRGLLVTQGREDLDDLKQNDVIVAINGVKVEHLNAAKSVMQSVKAGDEITLELISQGEPKTISITSIE